jgi:hypothetical protein
MRYLTLICLLSTTFFVFGQQKLGMVQDNYAGTIGSDFNPANLADSRFQFNMNVIGLDAFIQNNYVQAETPVQLRRFLSYSLDSNFLTENPNHSFQEYYVKERFNGWDKYVYGSTEVDYLNFQIGLNDKSGIEVHFGTKVFASVSNMPENAIKTFLQDLDTGGRTKENQYRLLGQTMNADGSGASALAYQQIGASYAFMVQESKRSALKLGFGVDYNVGLFGANARIKKGDYTLTGIDTLAMNNVDLEYNYTDFGWYNDPSWRVNDLLGSSKLGNGVGVNFGMVYEKRSKKAERYKMNRRTQTNRSENLYDWKIGASLTNVGFVTFNKPGAIRNIEVNNDNSTLIWNDFDEADSWNDPNDVDSFMVNFFPTADTTSKFTMYTPAAINLTGDYKIAEGFYLGAIYQQSLIRSVGQGVRTPSVVSIIPRFEKRWVSASMPISVGRYYNKVNIGAYVRAGVFYIGTDNLGSILTGAKTNGFNLYTGFNWPIHYNRMQDSDGDGVSDDMDKCAGIAGSDRTEGCPDTDGDKVRDSEDLCPNEPGSKRNGGCPDPDNDGVLGKDDKCPDVYGDKNTDGCPDTDGDGIHDGDDNCPETAGEAKYNGCPEMKLEPIHVDPPSPIKDTVKVVEPKETSFSKFDNWDFDTYEYWPILGAYNDVRWAYELQDRVKAQTGLSTTIQTIPGASKHYVTLGKATSIQEAKQIQSTLDLPAVNNELNGKIWWKKVAK